MSGFNLVVVMGNLTRDPELRYTANGKAVANFSLAVNGYNDEVYYANIVAWGKQAESAGQYLSKGSPALVHGSLQERTWDKDGQTQRKTEIVANNVKFIGKKGDNTKKAPSEVSDIEPF
jgi:single-strand DNA-binding protein